MSRFFTFLFITINLLFRCSENSIGPDQGSEKNTLNYKIEIVHGNRQQGTLGSFLADSLAIRIVDQNNKPVDRAKVKFKTFIGNGLTSFDYSQTDSTGIAYNFWKLGCTTGEQKMTTYLIDSSGMMIDSVAFIATSIQTNNWTKVCGLPFIRKYAKNIDYVPVSFIVQDQSYVIYTGSDYYHSKPYFSEDGGYNWMPMVEFPLNTYLQKALIQEDGDFFIVTREEGIYRRVRNENNWESVNYGINGFSYCEGFSSVSNDTLYYSNGNDIYVTFNNGDEWKSIKNKFGNYYDAIRQIIKHPEGKYFAVEEIYNHDFWSSDNGIDWTFHGEPNITSMYIDESGEIYAATDNFFTRNIIKSDDLGQSWKIINEFKSISGCDNEVVEFSKFEDNFVIKTCGNYFFSENLVEWNNPYQIIEPSFLSAILLTNEGDYLLGTWFDGILINANLN